MVSDAKTARKTSRQVTSFNQSGLIVHRSRNFSTREDAAAVAGWVNGLRPLKDARNQFMATVVENARTKRPAYFVELWPVHPERQAENQAREQAKRIEKSLDEGAAYSFAQVDHNSAWCLSTSGERYLIVGNTCGCPDFQKTGHAVACKHLLTANRVLGARK